MWVKVVLSGAQNIFYPQTFNFGLTITHQQMNIHVNCSRFLSLKKEKICFWRFEIDVVFMLNVHLHSIVPNGWGPNQLQYFGACSWEHCHWGASPTNSGALWIPRSAGNSGKHHDVPHETKLHCSSHYYDGKLQS